MHTTTPEKNCTTMFIVVLVLSKIHIFLFRLKFFQRWLLEALPDVFWFSGLFLPHTFLTGVRQNYARHKSIPIDQIYFKFLVKTYLLHIKPNWYQFKVEVYTQKIIENKR